MAAFHKPNGCSRLPPSTSFRGYLLFLSLWLSASVCVCVSLMICLLWLKLIRALCQLFKCFLSLRVLF